MSVGAVNKSTGDRIPTAGMPAIDNALSLSSTNPVQNRVVKAALDNKQATLTFDDVPTDGSDNPVKSNGIYDALATKQDATDNTLQTTDKTVVGAVNELKSGLINVDVALNVPENTGKNLLPFTLASLKALNASGTWADNVYTKNSVDFTVNTNASGQVVSIVVDGTATGGNADFDLTSNASIPDASKGLLFSGCPSGSASTYGLCRSGAGIIQFGGNDVAWPTSVTAVTTFIRVIDDATCDNVTFTPMLRDARITDATFAPYVPSVESRIEGLESGLTGVNSKFYNNTYTANNDYNLNVVISGSIVSVMGYVIGTETNEYCGAALPIPYATDYTAVVFSARNQNTGDFIQLRCGGSADNFKIYRTSSMTTGTPFAFSFSYNKATIS